MKDGMNVHTTAVDCHAKASACPPGTPRGTGLPFFANVAAKSFTDLG
eukprot:CAMPEP_0197675118 /NCGR_PEP_ID=MMETSP1338-20131121/84301_1 /TAXON_ID=43686 ORGANISM="Pelagodinium beii, Strain RCC1491" /NCGR_SAMPLE_ID=MMETSP1338 /ASSEMBLY_ACC=CAM_ASM_000754 /LENGTH=46 /DNA_ID= /DNA_START= /DNA_END= /DNA_ORIENTATION=